MKLDKMTNTIRNAFWGYIQKIFSILLPFILRTVIIYRLGVDYVGLNSLFTSILSVLSLSELGFGSAMIYSMYKPISENNKKEICSLLNLYKKVYRIIGILILCLGLLFIPFLSNFIYSPFPSDINLNFVYMLFLINTSISYLLFSYKSSLLIAHQRNDLLSKIDVLVNIPLYLIQIIVIYFTKQYYFYLLLILFGTILNNLFNLLVVNRLFPQYKCQGSVNKEEFIKIKKNVSALLLHKVGGTIINSVDNIIISTFLGLTVVAQYNNYYYIMNSVYAIVLIIFNGMTAGIGNSVFTEEKKKVKSDFNKVLFFNGWIASWFTVSLICIYQIFIEIWVGNSLLFSFNTVILISIYFFVHTIRRTIIVYRDATGKWWDNRFQPVISGLFNLIVNVILINIIGINGVIISTILSMILIDVPWEANTFYKTYIDNNIKNYYKKLFYWCIVTIIIGLITFKLCEIILYNLYISLIYRVIICILIPNIFFILINRKSKDYIYFKNLIFNKIINKNK
jgi:O-antigen/teichoic acid export membrane protein